VGQGSALSPILSALYLAPILYILEKHLKILKIPVSILSFVDNGLFVAQSKSFTILNSHLFFSYNIASNLLLWNIQRLKCFIFLDHMGILILSLLIYPF